MVLAWAALLGPAVLPAVASGSASLNWGSGIEPGVPNDAGTNPGADVGSVSCASAGNCTAVGGYVNASNNNLGLLSTQSAGSWNGVAEAQPPANASTSPPAVGVNDVSCALAGDCVAVGYYDDNLFGRAGLLLTQSGGSWSNGAQEAPLPSGAATQPDVALRSVDCPSAGNCSAVGTYYDASNNVQSVLLSESSGGWAPTEVTPPANHGGDPYVTALAVSCAFPGNCSAVGNYTDNTSHIRGLLLDESAGAWNPQGAEPKLPANANLAIGSGLISVSCLSLGGCTAIGGYFVGNSDLSEGLLLNESSGSWSTGTEAPLPPNPNASNPDVQLVSISCTSAANCSAVGAYHDSSNYQQGLLMTQSHGSWSTVEARLPANANANPNVSLRSVSCVSPGNCAAVGTYRDSADNPEGLLFTQYHGSWSTGVEAQLPANANTTNPNVGLNSVSCASAGNCSTVGGYTDSAGNLQGLLLGAAPVRPTLSSTAPAHGVVGSRIGPSTVAATLSGGNAPIGTIAFKVVGPRSTAPTSCRTGGTSVGTARATGNKSYHPSLAFTPHKPGSYWWYASYGGDASDTAATSKCGAGMARTVVHS